MDTVCYAVTMHGKARTYMGPGSGLFPFIEAIVAREGHDPSMKVEPQNPDAEPCPETPRSARPASLPAPESAPAVSVVQAPVSQPAPSSPRSAPPLFAGLSEDGRARALADREAAVKAGFTLKDTLYAIGTRVNETGVANARRSREEYDARPDANEALLAFERRIAAERRRDRNVLVSDLSMASDGKILAGQNGAWLSEEALTQLGQRLGMGGGDFLARCWPELRAHNVNEWVAKVRRDHEEACRLYARTSKRSAPPEAPSLKMRVRDARDGQREVYAVTSTAYTPFDVDKIAEAIRRANPGGKASIEYDGRRARFDILWHSNVAPEQYVCGEAFKAGAYVRTDDTGGGSIRGGGVAFFNRCLNLIIIDQAQRETMRIRHIGSIDDLTKTFRVGFKKALDSVEHFRKAWGVAHEENIVATAESGGESLEGKRLSEVLPGFFRGMLDRELVTIPGRKEETIEKLVSAWEWDTSSAKAQHNGINRAALVNAVTRAAHHDLDLDPWTQADLEKDAGALVYSRKPLPWVGAKSSD